MKIGASLLVAIGILIMLAACASYGFLLYISIRNDMPMSGFGIMLIGRPVTGTGYAIIHLILLLLGAMAAFFGWRKRGNIA